MVILFTTYGIGNRLRVIASIAKICKETNHKLIVFWPIEEDLNASYSDLFEKIEYKIISFKCNKYLHNFLLYFFKYNRACKLLKTLILNGDFILKNRGHKLYDFFFRYKLIFIRTCYEANNDYSLNIFNFNNTIKKKSIFTEIKNLNYNKLIGVHIRRADNIWSIENSSTQLFYNSMKQLTNKDNHIIFYIASDDPKEKEYFINKFGNRIITQPISSYNRNDLNGIVDSTIELYNLSLCKIILGSYGSSFSEIAHRIGNNQLKIITDTVKRESREQLENYIYSSSLPQLNKKEWLYYYINFIQLYRN